MLNKIITVAIFSTLFFSSYVLFKQPFEFYLVYFFILALLPFFILKYPFPGQLTRILFPLLVFGMISIWMGDNTYPFFFKIFLNLFVSILFYFYVFQAYRMDVNLLFSYYAKGAFIVALIGLVQFISFHIGFRYGYDFRLYGLNKWGVVTGGSFGIRVNSVFSEPSYFGEYIGPAFFISVFNLFRRQNYFFSTLQSVIIIVVYLLTFSSVAYLGIFVSLIILLVNFGFLRYVLIFTPIMVAGYFYLYANVEEFRNRLDGLDELYAGTAKSAHQVHGSSFVQYNNFHVATENFKLNPLFGSGLGSHQVAYNRFSLVKQFGGIYDFNQQDANSMFLRLMSETGLYGLIFIVLFIVKFFVLNPRDGTGDELWLISGAALVTIILQLLRQGNYTYNGFMFYMWLYYYTKQAATGVIDTTGPDED